MTALHYPGLKIDCYYCGHRSEADAMACEGCKRAFTFRTKDVSDWKGSEFYSWMFAYSFQLDEKAEAEGYATLPRNEQMHYLTGYFYTQVMNGGVGQYFFNPSGITSPELILALKDMGAVRLAAILEPVVQQFPDGQPPQEMKDRAACMDAMGDDDWWEALDEPVMALIDAKNSPEDLLELLYAACAAKSV